MARVVHFELPADDPERAVKFYEGVFGWQIQKWDGPQDYWLAHTGAPDTPGIDGAIMRRDPTMPSVVNTIDVKALGVDIAVVCQCGDRDLHTRIGARGIVRRNRRVVDGRHRDSDADSARCRFRVFHAIRELIVAIELASQLANMRPSRGDRLDIAVIDRDILRAADVHRRRVGGCVVVVGLLR